MSHQTKFQTPELLFQWNLYSIRLRSQAEWDQALNQRLEVMQLEEKQATILNGLSSEMDLISLTDCGLIWAIPSYSFKRQLGCLINLEMLSHSVGWFILFIYLFIVTSMMFLVSGSVMTLSKSGASWPVWMWNESMRSLVSLYRTPVAASRGSNINTDSQLKKSWTVAPANALEHTVRNIL